MKRLLTFLLTLTLMPTILSPGVYAGYAEAPAAGGSSEAVIFFDANTVDWNGYDAIGFHIWGDDGSGFDGFDWGSKKQRGSDPDGDGIWAYDLGSMGLKLYDPYSYYVIFYGISNNTCIAQTYTVVFGNACFGDVAYCTGEIINDNEDSSMNCYAAYWRNQDPKEYGTPLMFDAAGNVMGSCIPKSSSAESIFMSFLTNTLPGARLYGDRSDQELLDYVGDKLGLYRSDVHGLLRQAGVDADWSDDASVLPDYEAHGEPFVLLLASGDADMDGDLTVMDATRIQRFLAQLEPDERIDKIAADTDGDSDVTVMDATRIQRFLALNVASGDGKIKEHELV